MATSARRAACIASQLSGRAMSAGVSASGQCAEISASTIHTRYPEISELIREKMGKAMRVQRDQKQDELKKCKARIRALNAENAQLKAELASVTSRYATATIRLKQLEANSRPPLVGSVN